MSYNLICNFVYAIILVLWGYIANINYSRYVSVNENAISSRMWFVVSFLEMFWTIILLLDINSIQVIENARLLITIVQGVILLILINIFAERKGNRSVELIIESSSLVIVTLSIFESELTAHILFACMYLILLILIFTNKHLEYRFRFFVIGMFMVVRWFVLIMGFNVIAGTIYLTGLILLCLVFRDAHKTNKL